MSRFTSFFQVKSFFQSLFAGLAALETGSSGYVLDRQHGLEKQLRVLEERLALIEGHEVHKKDQIG